MNYRLIFFFTLVTISFLYEKLHIKCKKDNIGKELFSYIHHIIAIWIVFGTLIFNKYHLLHLFIFLAVWAHWQLMYSWLGMYGCILSRLYNNICNLPLDEKFRDIFYAVDDKRIMQTLYLYVMMYDAYFISKGNI